MSQVTQAASFDSDLASGGEKVYMTNYSAWRAGPSWLHEQRYFNADGLAARLVRHDELESVDEGSHRSVVSANDLTSPRDKAKARRESVRSTTPDQHDQDAATGTTQ